MLTHALQTVWAVTLPDPIGSNRLLQKGGLSLTGSTALYRSQNNLYQYRTHP
jgi:hypothetical protein